MVTPWGKGAPDQRKMMSSRFSTAKITLNTASERVTESVVTPGRLSECLTSSSQGQAFQRLGRKEGHINAKPTIQNRNLSTDISSRTGKAKSGRLRAIKGLALANKVMKITAPASGRAKVAINETIELRKWGRGRRAT